jgi:hypothetical protein
LPAFIVTVDGKQSQNLYAEWYREVPSVAETLNCKMKQSLENAEEGSFVNVNLDNEQPTTMSMTSNGGNYLEKV